MNFDPFAIGPSHSDHSRSTSIIKLEESGRIVCPKCLSKTFVRGIETIEETLFNSYINNFFEILDQHGEKDDLRKTSLVILEAIVEKNPIRCRSEHGFHNFLRILYKVMNSNLFNRYEFCAIARILSNISENFPNFSHTHLVFTWKAYHHLLIYAEKDANQFPVSFSPGERMASVRFIGSIAAIIRTYLTILSRFRISQTAELLLPLSKDDKIINHNRHQYITNQLECLRIMSSCLIPCCWPHLRLTQTSFEVEEDSSVGLFFEALSSCFLTAVLLNQENFIHLVKSMDTLATAHNLARINRSDNFRRTLKGYLKRYICHFIEEDLGTDKIYNQFMRQSDETVEINHKNAIFYLTNPLKYDKIKTYILANYVARKQNSTFFTTDRVKKVLKLADPWKLNFQSSKVTMRAYNFLAALLVPKIDKSENVSQFVQRRWQRFRAESNLRSFNEEYCFEGQVFKWTVENLLRVLPERPHVSRFISTKVIEYAIKRAGEIDQIHIYLPVMLNNKLYKDKLIEYLKHNVTANAFVETILKLVTKKSEPIEHKLIHAHIFKELCDLIPAILSIVIFKHKNSNEKKHIDQIHQILTMLVMMLDSCPGYDPIFDDEFIVNLFLFIESLYGENDSNEELDDILVLVNRLIVALFERNCPFLMKIVKELNYRALGKMYIKLSDYSRDDKLAESIAQMVVAYDKIDYPMKHDIRTSILSMASSIPNWLFSKNYHLHSLSIRLLKNTMKVTENHKSARASVCTGIIHMIVGNPELLEDRAKLIAVLEVIDTEELKFNPLLGYMLDAVSDSCREEINAKLGEERPPSPAVSFSSGESEDIDSIRIADILSQLPNDDEEHDGGTSRIPNSLFVSSTVTDQHLPTVNIEDWERVAYEMNKSDEDF